VMTVVHEWRVTGQPQSSHGVEFPPYLFVWRSDRSYDDRSRTDGAPVLSAEEAARRFAGAMQDWDDGPHLSHRTVTYSSWEAIA
jgi:hypothetical protein